MMALLSIVEPGQSQAPHQHRLAIGIDLGTTNSLVAAVCDGMATVLPDEDGLRLLPSVVQYFGDGRIDVGHEANRNQAIDPFNTLSSVKRLMGRGLADLPEPQRRAYRLLAANGMVKLETIAGARSPVEVSAEILKVLRVRAEQSLGGELGGAVITVPAYCDDAQRQATKDAARLAGLNVLRLLNEPTAAAVAYGLERAGEGVFAVYDLGGGTFDISILRLSRGVFEVLAVNGDSALGGDDFDHAVYDWIVAQANVTTPSPSDQRLMLQQARKAKECLSSQHAADIFARISAGQQVNLELERATLDQLTAALVAKTMAPVRNALAGNRSATGDWLLLDVIPLSLGLETMGGLTERIIPRNSTLPVARAQDFTTFKDGQTAMSIHVVQGERERVADCRSLARFELRDLPPLVAGAARIRVTFQVDADGLLSVTAREQSTGVEANVTVKPSYGLSDAEIAAMLQDSHTHAELDAQLRSLHEHVLEAERLLESIDSALQTEDDSWLNDVERANLDSAMTWLRETLKDSDADRIRSAAQALNQLSTPLAARRMDSAVSKALAGRRLADFA